MTLDERDAGRAPQDAEREAGLERLYREAATEQPTARLDAAIMAAARREVGARPRTLSGGLRRWRMPVSIAAAVVLSFSLVTLVREEGGEDLVQLKPPRPASPVAPPAAAPAVADAPVTGALEAVRPASPPATPPATVRRNASARADREKDLPEPAKSVVGSQAASEPAVVQPRGESSVAAPAPQPFQGPPRDSGERRAAAASAAEQEDRAPAPAAARRAPAAGAASADPAERARLAAQARESTAAGAERLPVWQGYDKEPPQRWLERIAELRRLGRGGDATEMLAEFKRRFPGHPLPPDQ